MSLSRASTRGSYSRIEGVTLDLKLVQENFQKAKDEATGMIGENLTIVFILLPIIDSDLLVILQKK